MHRFNKLYESVINDNTMSDDLIVALHNGTLKTKLSRINLNNISIQELDYVIWDAWSHNMKDELRMLITDKRIVKLFLKNPQYTKQFEKYKSVII